MVVKKVKHITTYEKITYSNFSEELRCFILTNQKGFIPFFNLNIFTVVEFFKSLCSLFHITGPLILRHIDFSVVLQYIFLKCPA